MKNILFILFYLIPKLVFADIQIFANIKEEITVSKSHLIGIYTGRISSWENGTKITLLLLRHSVIQRKFIREVLGMSPIQYFSFYHSRNHGPKNYKFTTENNIVELLTEIKGSVGIVQPYFIMYNYIPNDYVKRIIVK